MNILNDLDLLSGNNIYTEERNNSISMPIPELNIKDSSSISSLDSVSGYNVPLEQNQVIDTTESSDSVEYLSAFNINDNEINQKSIKKSPESTESFLLGFNVESNESNSFDFLSGYNDVENKILEISSRINTELNISSNISDYNSKSFCDRSIQKSASGEADSIAFKSFQGVCRVIDSENNNDLNLCTINVMTEEKDETDKIYINQHSAENQASGN